jgi:fimbrial chaperone protein
MFAGAPASPETLEAGVAGDALLLRNPGPGWLRLHGLSLQTEDRGAVPAGPGIVYLLPGSELSLPPPEETRVSALNYSVNGQSFSAQFRPVR